MTPREAAVGYARRGIAVVPTVPRTKAPLTEHGGYDASTDEDDIERWWRAWPFANVAIATGMSGLVVLDIDAHVDKETGEVIDGYATLAAVELELGALPDTLTSKTPNGGAHRWFRAPEGIELRQATGRIGSRITPGLDVRAGFATLCTAPPSAIDGRRYAWALRSTPATLPDLWVEAIRVREQPPAPKPDFDVNARECSRVRFYCLRAVQNAARGLANLPRGRRNKELWNAAAALGGLVSTGQLYTSEVEDALEWACSQWRDRKVRKDRNTIVRGIRFGLEHPREVQL